MAETQTLESTEDVDYMTNEEIALAFSEASKITFGENTTEEYLQALAEKWEIVPDCNTKDGYESVRIGIGEHVKIRTGVKNRVKELKLGAQDYIKNVNSTGGEIIDRVLLTEAKLRSAKNEVDEFKKAEKIRKIKAEQERVNNIRNRITAISDIGNIKFGATKKDIENALEAVKGIECGEDFQEFLTEAMGTQVKTANYLLGLLKQAEDARVEADKIAKENAEAKAKLDTEKAELAAEKEKIKTEKAAQIAAEKAEAAEKAIIKNTLEDNELQKERRGDIIGALIVAYETGGFDCIADALINNAIKHVKYTG